MIENEDISVIIQGPVGDYQGRKQQAGSILRCMSSIRRNLPGSKIILSTWENQDLSGLDFDQLVTSVDPGPNDDDFCPVNYNRQILSTKAGLRQATTPYSLKIRGDCYLTGDQFRHVQQRYQAVNEADRIFEEKVIINSTLFRRFSRCREVALFPSDFFYFGLTRDLRKIWDQSLFANQPFANYLLERRRKHTYLSPLEAEQVYCVIWLHTLTNKSPLMAYRFDCTEQDLEFWRRFVASNLIVFEPARIGMGLREQSIKSRTKPNDFTSWDWLSLYRQYCDSSVKVGWPKNRLRIELKRRIVYPPGRLWHKLTEISRQQHLISRPG